MEIIGKVYKLDQTQEVGANNFKKRLIVIESDEQYSQKIPVDFVQDKTSILDNYQVGDSVKVSVNVRGNEYQGKFYVNLQGWRIEKLSEASGTPPMPQEQNTTYNMPEEDDDMPF